MRIIVDLFVMQKLAHTFSWQWHPYDVETLKIFYQLMPMFLRLKEYFRNAQEEMKTRHHTALMVYNQW